MIVQKGVIERNTKVGEFLLKGRSVLVLGPRACGKSFYLKGLFAPQRNTFTTDLLSRESFQRYLREPARFYDEVSSRIKKSNEPLFVLVDEVQLLPELLFEVHRLIEEFRDQVVFALTGSSARKLRRGHGDLLAARALSFKFFPFTSSEVDLVSNLDRVLQFGTLPEVFLENKTEIAVEILRTYAEKYLREEIQQESAVRNLPGFSRFLELAAFANGEPINYAKIAKSAGLHGDTVKEYYQILVDTLLGTLLPAWDRSVRKQLTKAPKFYFFDTGVLNALRGELQTELKSSSYRYGRLFESFVVQEVLRRVDTERLTASFSHYRTNHGQEIDLIAQRNLSSAPIAIKINSSLSPQPSKVRPLFHFREEHPTASCFVLCQTPHHYGKDSIHFFPWHQGISEICNALR